MMVLFRGLAIAGVVFLVRSTRHDRDRRPRAHEVVDERFARGERSVEEYGQHRTVLRRADSSRG